MAQRYRYNELAPEGMAALRGVEHYLNTGTSFSPVLLELVRLRCSVLNGCSFCIGLHTAELRKHREPDTRIDAVRNEPSSTVFTPREQAALLWADSLTNIQQGHASDADYAAVSTFFRDKDLTDLTLTICSINAWNRLAISSALEWAPRSAPQSPQSPSAARGEPAFSPQVVAAQGTTAAIDSDEAHDDKADDGGKAAQD